MGHCPVRLYKQEPPMESLKMPYARSRPSRSPLVASVLVLFSLGVVLLIALASALVVRRETLPDFHIHAERVDALRWLAQHLVPAQGGETPPPCRPDDRLCIAATAINLRLAKAPGPQILQLDDAAPDPGEQAALIRVAEELARKPASTDINQVLKDSLLNDFELRGNPFRLPGCVYGGSGMERKRLPSRSRCIDGTPLDTDKHFPPGMVPIRKLLADFRQPWDGASFREHAGLAVGRDTWLTLDADKQTLAQRTAACYTGDPKACAGAWWYPARHASAMYEQARARSVGITLIDVQSGAILAMAASHSRCFQAHAAGNPAPQGCPQVPDPRPRMNRLANPAIEAEMPGSLYKPQQALALLSAGNLTESERAKLPDILRRSDSEAMIDLYLCQERGFDKACIARRVGALEKRLAASGFNQCAPGKRGCQAELDLLGAGPHSGATLIHLAYKDRQVTRETKPLQRPVFGARALVDKDGRSLASSVAELSPAAMDACYKHGNKQRWRGCQGKALIDLIAELYGQGNARASLLGMAGGWLDLAAAAAQGAQAPRPHLLAAYLDDQGSRHTVHPTATHGIDGEHARFVLAALQHVTARGSAAAACKAASSVGGALDCRAPANGLRIQAKTGTPLMPADRLEYRPDQLTAWRQRCGAKGECGLRPLKWFAALVTPPGASRPSTLVIVRAERNWYLDGHIDDAGDSSADGNVAAEIGLALINVLHTPGKEMQP